MVIPVIVHPINVSPDCIPDGVEANEEGEENGVDHRFQVVEELFPFVDGHFDAVEANVSEEGDGEAVAKEAVEVLGGVVPDAAAPEVEHEQGLKDKERIND